MRGPGSVIAYPASLLDRAAWNHIQLGHHQVFYGWDGFLWQFFSWGSVAHYRLIVVLTLAALGTLTQAWRDDSFQAVEAVLAAA